ncbi:MAG: hypothetical protein V9F03_11975 [Microthrixaceae bacterium]
MRRRSSLSIAISAVVVILGHPDLWLTAIRQAFRLVPNRWWTRRPFLPVPDAGYMHFRLVTAYGGDGEGQVDPNDLITYLRWCRSWPA